jgi:hypothetical protein
MVARLTSSEKGSPMPAVGADHLSLEQLDVLDLDAGVLEQTDTGVEAVHHRRFIVHPGAFDVVAALLRAAREESARATCRCGARATLMTCGR